MTDDPLFPFEQAFYDYQDAKRTLRSAQSCMDENQFRVDEARSRYIAAQAKKIQAIATLKAHLTPETFAELFKDEPVTP